MPPFACFLTLRDVKAASCKIGLEIVMRVLAKSRTTGGLEGADSTIRMDNSWIGDGLRIAWVRSARY